MSQSCNLTTVFWSHESTFSAKSTPIYKDRVRERTHAE